MTSTRELTQRHRAQQLLLRRATQASAAQVFTLLDWEHLDESYARFALTAASLVEANRRTSAGLAAAYLREFRKAERVGGTAKIVLAPSLIPEQFSTSLRVTSIVAVKSAAAEGTAADVAMGNALTQTKGALARLVLNAGRETVTGSLREDSRAIGYQRVLGGSGCDFCQMLAGRGGVYGAESVEFDAHDHCGCTAEPVYRA